MPELPEVETVRLGLQPALVGKRFAAVEQRRADLRFPFPARFASRLEGRRVVSLERRAKYLMARLDDGEVLIMHLGMTGTFSIDHANGSAVKPGAYVHGKNDLPPHEHVVFHMDDGTLVRYADARRFGYMDLIPEDALGEHKLFKGLGFEPLGDELSAAALALRLKGKKTPLKAALLDQRVIAGLGNIYVCEALYEARLSPLRLAGTLASKTGKPNEKTARLVAAIKQVLRAAVAAGGSSLRDYVHTDGALGAFQHRFKVYGKEGKPCPGKGCTGTVKRIVQSGRSTFYCPSCQK